jgi:hypothetical protein
MRGGGWIFRITMQQSMPSEAMPTSCTLARSVGTDGFKHKRIFCSRLPLRDQIKSTKIPIQMLESMAVFLGIRAEWPA